MTRLAGLLALSLLLSGCIVQQKPAPVEPTQPVHPVQPPVTAPQEPVEPPQPPETVPQPPKLQSLNWDASVRPLVAKMLRTEGVTPGSVLLVAGVRNNTNGSIQSAKVTSAVSAALSDQKLFTLVSAPQLEAARQSLGLSAEDSLSTRSKAIGIARAASAQYVLYTSVNGDVKSPTVQMMLMLVQSGEIIWSGNGVVQN
ncbi:penicillin-binding protein activator LpoB [Erwinia sp. OLTSP20]|uniref:penicillin-binding protein activator LpoB n=1 Tax=unclassified Erwinia TaxID=2622719 RepID=UPI000C187F3D|nr:MULTISPECIES: penicillin-binding protein activator LpoB [unclassified Erwinia]PIJ51993.1 penicillin-binding protein activator LpoB [Erwinia sp. OAMSP11]PIJ74867.1 penicillin-binding protein activator LpoB [Erwinia sp. OLSSP12]PIJ85234.1 penicillin-binding protein activator LpoB [Erwinia sp. OLCASP19]PIJ87235.1 penicillin-binding protein activator LpoB [Erwinia sp. OLMTSP26]PIJ88398.1 penicillin-binding protein activator LpoB [Erwinia sp. OLMDSP33]